jgi:hypothetical protein
MHSLVVVLIPFMLQQHHVHPLLLLTPITEKLMLAGYRRLVGTSSTSVKTRLHNSLLLGPRWRQLHRC